MIEYYSTLNHKLYEKESQAKFAEENFVDKYFRKIEEEAERARRARNIIIRDGALSISKNF